MAVTVGGLRLDEPEVYCALSDRAQAALARVAVFCANRTRDGVVSLAELAALLVKPSARKELIDGGFWRELADQSIEIVDYLKHNPSRAEVEATRALAMRRAALRSDPAIMRHVKARDGGLCRYCGVVVDWSDRRGRLGGTYDHVIPIVQNGTDSIENIVTACRRCNSVKGGRTPEQADLVLLPVGYQVPTGGLPVDSTGSEPANGTCVSPLELPSALPLDLKSSPDLKTSPALTSSSDLTGSARVKRSRRRTALPADWKPTPEHIERASKTGLDLDREVTRFRAHHEAKGSLMANWNAAFTTWLLNAVDFARPPGAVAHEKTRQEEARRPYHEPFPPEPSGPKASPADAYQAALAGMAAANGRRVV